MLIFFHYFFQLIMNAYLCRLFIYMEKFKNLGLNSNLLKAIEDLGFEEPSQVQEKAIPLLLEREIDLVGLAQTGTGKTAAFGFPLLQKIDSESKKTQGLILAPTRELCLQITNELNHYAKYIKGVNIVAIYGGASISAQEKSIKRGAQIIVATPGRMKDMLKRRIIDISKISYSILDEADEMLNMGFYEDITAILKYAPATKKTWLFSATMPKEVSRIAKEFMTDPTEITVGTKNESTTNVSHEYYVVGARDRYKALKSLADANPEIFSVIFCRTKRDTQKVAERLAEDGYNAAAIHGDLSQGQRDLVMKSFRNRQIQMLVATDVAARGIDVNNITHVINYQLPDEIEIYTHRSGRTGRAGKNGVSIVLITKSEKRKIKRIESTINQKFEQKYIPSGEQICQVQLFHLAKNIKETEVNPHIEKYIEALKGDFEDLSKEELIKKMFSVEFTRFYNYYKNGPDLNAKAQSKGSEGSRNDGSTRYFINIGERDGFDWQSLKDFLKEELKMSQDEVSSVDVKDSFSFFNTDQSESQKVFDTFKHFDYQGRSVNVEETNNKDKSSKSRKYGKSKGKSPRRGGKGGNNKKFKGGRRSNIKSSINRRKGKRNK